MCLSYIFLFPFKKTKSYHHSFLPAIDITLWQIPWQTVHNVPKSLATDKTQKCPPTLKYLCWMTTLTMPTLGGNRICRILDAVVTTYTVQFIHTYHTRNSNKRHVGWLFEHGQSWLWKYSWLKLEPKQLWYIRWIL